MAAFNKFYQFVEDLAKNKYNLDTDAFKVMLTNTAPVATNAVYGDISGNEVASGNGYTTGGNAAAFVSGAQTSGTFKLVLGAPAVWTAVGGTIGPFRYAVLYDTTPTSPLKPLVGWWDYLSSITLQIGETFTVALDQSAGVLTLA